MLLQRQQGPSSRCRSNNRQPGERNEANLNKGTRLVDSSHERVSNYFRAASSLAKARERDRRPVSRPKSSANDRLFNVEPFTNRSIRRWPYRGCPGKRKYSQWGKSGPRFRWLRMELILIALQEERIFELLARVPALQQGVSLFIFGQCCGTRAATGSSRARVSIRFGYWNFRCSQRIWRRHFERFRSIRHWLQRSSLLPF